MSAASNLCKSSSSTTRRQRVEPPAAVRRRPARRQQQIFRLESETPGKGSEGIYRLECETSRLSCFIVVALGCNFNLPIGLAAGYSLILLGCRAWSPGQCPGSPGLGPAPAGVCNLTRFLAIYYLAPSLPHPILLSRFWVCICHRIEDTYVRPYSFIIMHL
jgi:hypothetical protein